MKIRRLQPPVGYRVPVSKVMSAAARGLMVRGARERLEQQVAQRFGVRRAFAVSSGKAALTTALRALHAQTGRRKVILPAYTCYSVPSAIVRAGMVPLPVDIAPGTFDYHYGQLQSALDRDVLCALSVHLFGIPSDTHRLTRVCEPAGIFVIEDAAQAMGVTSRGELLGTRADVGFFSFGRGKNITCGAGGLIVTKVPEIAGALQSCANELLRPGAAQDLGSILELCAMSMFISPRLYWLPAGIPSLRLGETIFHVDYPVRLLSDVQAHVLDGWEERLAQLNALRRQTGALYRRHISAAVGGDDDVPYLRFPVLVEDAEVREHILRQGRAYGIGVMYPGSVGAITEIHALLSQQRFPEAERIASSLVTLPTHPLLTERDRMRICEVVNASAPTVSLSAAALRRS